MVRCLIFARFFGGWGVFGTISLTLDLLVLIVLVIVFLIFILLIIFFFILVLRILIIFLVVVRRWAMVVVCYGLGMDFILMFLSLLLLLC